MSLGAKMSSDILVTALFKTSLKVRGLVFIPILTISLGVADYGAYAQVTAIGTLVGLACLLGYDSGYVRHIHETDQEARLYSSLVVVAFTTSVIGALLMTGAAGFLAGYTLQATEYTVLFAIGGLYALGHSMFQLARTYYRAKRQIKFYSFIEAADVYLSVGAVATVVLLFDGTIEHALGTLVASHLLMTGLMFVDIGRRGGLGVPTTHGVKDCTRFSVGAMGNQIAGSLLYKIDRVLIGFFLGASAVGIYSAAYSVAQLIKLFYQPISISFFPEFSELWTDEQYEDIQHYMQAGIRYAAIIGIPAVTGFTLVGEGVLNLLSTPEVANTGHSVLILIGAGLLLRGIGVFYSQLFYAMGTSKVPFMITGITVVLNIALNILLIPLLGINGAAFTTVVSFGAAALATGSLWQRYLPIRPEIGSIGRALIASGVMMLSFVFVELPWPVVVAAAPLIYFGTFIIIGGLNDREVQMLKQAVP